jgi:hypothetical protein
VNYVITLFTTGNESLHEISNENGVRLVNFATSKNLRVKSSMFPNRNIHKYTWASPDGKTRSQIDYILVDRQRYSNVLHVQLFRATDCDSDHYWMVAKVRDRRALNKQRSHRLHMERFNEQFRVEVSNRFAALEHLDAEMDSNRSVALEDLDAEVEINSPWETIR